MIASPRFVAAVASSSLVLLVVLFSTLPAICSGLDVLSLIPSEMLELVPEECRDSDDSEFAVAVGCAMDNLVECIGLLRVLPQFEDIPSAANVTDCEDIQEPFCDIAGTCPPCLELFDDVIRCMVLNSPEIDANVTELVDSCSLDCLQSTVSLREQFSDVEILDVEIPDVETLRDVY